tara:strand:- start:315 stop:569 length:255 start_codon:yes stop_codon:yes gene_type:complete
MSKWPKTAMENAVQQLQTEHGPGGKCMQTSSEPQKNKRPMNGRNVSKHTETSQKWPKTSDGIAVQQLQTENGPGGSACTPRSEP